MVRGTPQHDRKRFEPEHFPSVESSPKELHSTIMSLLVGAAVADPRARQSQIERFIHLYGQPLQNYLRRRRQLESALAEEWVHDFIIDKLFLAEPARNLAARFLECKRTEPSRRFRAYLLTALNHYTTDRLRHGRREVQTENGVEALLAQDNHVEAADVFEWDWAQNLLWQAVHQLEKECRAGDQDVVWQVFDLRVLRPACQGETAPSYDQLRHELELRTPKECSNRLQTAYRKFHRILNNLIRDFLPATSEEVLAGEVKNEFIDLRRIIGGGPPDITNAGSKSFVGESAQQLVDLSENTETPWDQRDLVGIWQHLLSIPATKLLQDWGAAHHVDDLSPAATLADLWQQPRPSEDALRALQKSVKRASTRPADGSASEVPPVVGGAVYATCLAVAFLRHGSRLSKFNDRELRERVDFVARLPWLDHTTKDILRHCLAQLNG